MGPVRRLPTEAELTLRQADQARADFAAITDDLEFIMAQLAQMPRRNDLVWVALASFLCGTVLAACLDLVFGRGGGDLQRQEFLSSGLLTSLVR
jgi:hypothetical protein